LLEGENGGPPKLKGFAARILLKNVDPRVRPGMTANVRIPVASADNVMAVPLAAVFTEKNQETGVYERFVYVQQDEAFEKRIVKVGVSDFFFAEIQEGLSAGEVVSLELPKEEREKKTRQLAGKRPGSGESEPVSLKSASGSLSNSPTGTKSGNRRGSRSEGGGPR